MIYDACVKSLGYDPMWVCHNIRLYILIARALLVIKRIGVC